MPPLKASISKPLQGGPSFSFQNRVYRAVWNISWWLLASWTPPPLHRWRCLLLNCFGARIDYSSRIYGTAKIWYPPNLTMGRHAIVGPCAIIYCQDKINICEGATISQGAHLCTGTHNISDIDFQLVTSPIFIGFRAWIAAEVFIGPGVVVGECAVIGARTTLFRNADPYGVYIGNPAIKIKNRKFI